MNKAFLVNDLTFGDGGKGSCVDYLCRKYNCKTVIRSSGSSQCGHNIVTPEGKHHCFSSFGAGTLAGAKTYLSEFMPISPIAMLNEADKLAALGINAFENTFVAGGATIVTPFHALANKIKERARGNKRHGSCGQGLGEARQDEIDGFKLTVWDLLNPDWTEKKLKEFKARKWEEIKDLEGEELTSRFLDPDLLFTTLHNYSEFITKIRLDSLALERFLDEGNVVFEGAQGVLLDEKWGFPPYNTWTDVTYNNALDLLDGYNGDIVKLGLSRIYASRHGAGPFVTEDKTLDLAEPHNPFNEWQREFRLGHLDLVALKYAINCLGGIDGLVISHLDCLDKLAFNGKIKVCALYQGVHLAKGFIPNQESTKDLFKTKPMYVEIPKEDVLDYIEEYLGVKITIKSFGPTWKDKIDS